MSEKQSYIDYFASLGGEVIIQIFVVIGAISSLIAVIGGIVSINNKFNSLSRQIGDTKGEMDKVIIEIKHIQDDLRENRQHLRDTENKILTAIQIERVFRLMPDERNTRY